MAGKRQSRKGGASRGGGAARKSGGKKRSSSAAHAPRAGAASAPAPGDPYGIDGLVGIALKSASELLRITDPLEAEAWASTTLGLFYKMPVSFEVQAELDRSLMPRLVQGAERLRNAAGLAVLCALGAVTGDAHGVREAAARMAAHGVPRPRWADVIGSPEYLDGWLVTDGFADQVAFYLTFQYPGRRPHMAMALYDENLGGIIKDAFVAALREGGDPRSLLQTDPTVDVLDADPAEAAARIRSAIATGDTFVDDSWTDQFKQTRALLLARVGLLPEGEWQPPEPAGLDEQEDLTQEFLASPLAPPGETTLAIIDQAMISRCDFGDGDPLRWSPTVVELFLMDYLPRKSTLDDAAADAVPEVLEAWVRFALAKRGLDQRLVDETVDAVRRFAPDFREAMADPANLSPAKRVILAMKADGVDLGDQEAVDAWLQDYNARAADEPNGV